MANIFISYNRQAESITKSLISDIVEQGHNAWFDQDLSGGQSWWDKILAEIRDCDVFVFVLDSATLNSTACKREMAYAADLGKPILPVLVADGVSVNVLPPALSKIHLIDYRQQDKASALRLAKAFNSIKKFDPLPEPLPAPPEAPISYLSNLAEQVETNASLSFEQQSALVINLKKGLRNPNTTDDTLSLFLKLRKRDDIYEAIAEEVNEIIEKATAAINPLSDSAKRSNPKHTTKEHDLKIPQHQWKFNAFVWVIAALIIGIVMILRLVGNLEPIIFLCVLMHIITWGISGAINGYLYGSYSKSLINHNYKGFINLIVSTWFICLVFISLLDLSAYEVRKQFVDYHFWEALGGSLLLSGLSMIITQIFYQLLRFFFFMPKVLAFANNVFSWSINKVRSWM